MRSRRSSILAILALALGLTGCHGKNARNQMAAEPPLDAISVGEPGTSVVVQDPMPSSKPAWVERHPLFSKPGEYYANTDSNVIVKGAAATVVGIPAGMMGEMKQIVVGRPANPAPY